MSKDMFGYKVVLHLIDNKLHSCMVGVNSYLHTIYYPNRWNTANPESYKLGYGLVFFKLKKDAQNFIWSNYRFFDIEYVKLLKVECRGVIDPPKARLHPYCLNNTKEGFLQKLVEDIRLGEIWQYDMVWNWPEGTLMCESMKLIEEVRK